MREENFRQLYDKYPDLFSCDKGPIKQSLMAVECECEGGWAHLIETFCRLVKCYLRQENTPTDFKFVQIKEKFGGLRLYYNLNTQASPAREKEIHAYIQGLTAFAEEMSYQTCENTGAPGKLFTKGWHKTLCDAEAKRLGYIN